MKLEGQDYVTILAAAIGLAGLAGTVIAALSPTEVEEKGRKKPTPIGAMALVIAVVGGLGGVGSEFLKRQIEINKDHEAGIRRANDELIHKRDEQFQREVRAWDEKTSASAKKITDNTSEALERQDKAFRRMVSDFAKTENNFAHNAEQNQTNLTTILGGGLKTDRLTWIIHIRHPMTKAHVAEKSLFPGIPERMYSILLFKIEPSALYGPRLLNTDARTLVEYSDSSSSEGNSATIFLDNAMLQSKVPSVISAEAAYVDMLRHAPLTRISIFSERVFANSREFEDFKLRNPDIEVAILVPLSENSISVKFKMPIAVIEAVRRDVSNSAISSDITYETQNKEFSMHDELVSRIDIPKATNYILNVDFVSSGAPKIVGRGDMSLFMPQ